MRIIQISDTHLSRVHPYFATNNAMIARWLAAQRSELIVHTGDLSMDGAGSATDLEFSQAWERANVGEILVVPGNHDVGDLASIHPRQPVNDERLAAWRRHVGLDRWHRDVGGWRLIGLNAMLLGTGHVEEERQFEWFAQALDCSTPIAIFLHKPLFIDHPDEGPRGYWTVAPEPRARMLTLMQRASVRTIASGHLHIYRQLQHGGINHVWGPAASFVVGSSQEDLGGQRKLGVIAHTFSSTSVTSEFIRPDGLEDLEIEPVQHILYPPVPLSVRSAG
jgi:alkaline phosphatase D